MSTPEIRVLASTEVRAMGGSGDADPLRIEGYAAVFNTNAQLPGFQERMRSGAFTRAVGEKHDVVCLFNHNPDVVLGRTTSGTLRIAQDAKGLHFACDLPNTSYARDIHTMISRGDVNGCSFAFTIPDGGQEWSEARDTDGHYFVQRDISDVDLIDVSPVTHPCYKGTEVNARTSAEVPMELRAAVDAKNAALIAPPTVEKRPYSTVADVPDSVPAADKKQWMEVWNSVYKKELAGGKSAKDAESSAFQQANGVIKNKKDALPGEKRDAAIAAEGTPADQVVDDGELSFEDIRNAIAAAIGAKFGCAPNTNWPMWCVVDTFQGYVIACACEGGYCGPVGYDNDGCKYAKISWSVDDNGDITVGDLVTVELAKEYVMSNDARVRINKEFRVLAEQRDEDDDDEDMLDDDFDLGLIGRSYDEDSEHDNHSDDGDCSEGDCGCQNRWSVTGSGSRAKAGVLGEVGAQPVAEKRGGFTKTKRVAGKDLTASSFAYVGDPDKTETWKLPIMDANHVRNALARFNQTQGIPADSKAGVLAKIHAAAKKFGIDTAESKSFEPYTAEERATLLAKAAATFDPSVVVRYSPDQPRHSESGQFLDSDGADEQAHGIKVGDKVSLKADFPIASKAQVTAVKGNTLTVQHANGKIEYWHGGYVTKHDPPEQVPITPTTVAPPAANNGVTT